MNYPNLIKKLREVLILSQTELAEMLGVSFSTVNRWENGKHEPTIKVKRKIVEICKGNNIKIDDNEGEH
jgi:DNA-binding XRE family transcriptional regulator